MSPPVEARSYRESENRVVREVTAPQRTLLYVGGTAGKLMMNKDRITEVMSKDVKKKPPKKLKQYNIPKHDSKIQQVTNIKHIICNKLHNQLD